MEHTIKKRLWLLAMVFVLALATFTGCGARKPGIRDYVGYYTLFFEDSYNIAMEIRKDGTVVYMNERSGSHRGTIEIEEDVAVIYLLKEYDSGREKNSSYAKYCPLTLKLVNSGKQGMLSSEHDNWITDSFDVVDKETFDYIINEDSTGLVLYDGKDWLTWEDRNPELAAEREAERLRQQEQQQAEQRDREMSWIREMSEEDLRMYVTELSYLIEDVERDECVAILEEGGFFGEVMDTIMLRYLDEIEKNGIDQDTYLYAGDLSGILKDIRNLE